MIEIEQKKLFFRPPTVISPSGDGEMTVGGRKRMGRRQNRIFLLESKYQKTALISVLQVMPEKRVFLALLTQITNPKPS
jgi:hypothetical protein